MILFIIYFIFSFSWLSGPFWKVEITTHRPTIFVHNPFAREAGRNLKSKKGSLDLDRNNFATLDHCIITVIGLICRPHIIYLIKTLLMVGNGGGSTVRHSLLFLDC